jgi:hypothetical protein
VAATFTVTEVFRDNSAGGDPREHTYTRHFFVESSGPASDVAVVAAPGIPIFGSVYVHPPSGFVDMGAWAKRIEARRREEHPDFFDVEVEYSNVLDRAPGGGANPSLGGGTGGSPLQQQDSPLLRPPSVRFGSKTYTVHVTEDVHGDPIVNTAGAPFEAGLEVERARLTMTLTRNVLAALINPVFANGYVGCINDAAWLGFAARQAKVTAWSTSERKYDRGVYYFEETWEFEFAPQLTTWGRRVLNAGWYYLDPAVTPPAAAEKPFVDAYGRPKGSVGMLKADGDRLPDGDDPIFLEFDVHPEADFSALNIS